MATENDESIYIPVFRWFNVQPAYKQWLVFKLQGSKMHTFLCRHKPMVWPQRMINMCIWHFLNSYLNSKFIPVTYQLCRESNCLQSSQLSIIHIIHRNNITQIKCFTTVTRAPITENLEVAMHSPSFFPFIKHWKLISNLQYSL